MQKSIAACLFLGAGLVLGRVLDGVLTTTATAAGGGGVDGGEEACAERNGDVDADGNVTFLDAITILFHVFQGSPAELAPICMQPAAPPGLPDSGQSSCYGSTDGQWGIQPCGETVCPGQDGAYATGCPPEGRFVDNGDGTVTDACTGLMWQRETADVTGDGQSTNDDNLSWCLALHYCEDLSLAGHDDWRLPNVRELQSIVDYGRSGLAIDPVFGALPLGYWSSTSRAVGPAGAWTVWFLHGSVLDIDEDYGPFVRAVRNGG